MKNWVAFLFWIMLMPLLTGCAAEKGKIVVAPGQPAKEQAPGEATSLKSAKACILLDDKRSHVQWDNQSKLVGVKLIYGNKCDRPVRCTVQIETGTIESDGDSRLLKGWKVQERQGISFDLPPRKEIPLKGSVPWKDIKKRVAVIRFPQTPDFDMDYLQCHYQ